MCGPRCHVFCGGRRECQSRNCVEGCFCDSDMVELGETCVRPEDCPVPGTCTSYHNPPPHTIIPLYTVAYERGYIFKAYLNQCSHVATESTTAPPSPSSSTNTTTLTLFFITLPLIQSLPLYIVAYERGYMYVYMYVFKAYPNQCSHVHV